MSLLLRKINGGTSPWQKLLQTATLQKLTAAPPLWVAKEFMPGERENGSISVYEVSNDLEVDKIAGAFAFNDPKLEGQIAFLSALRKDVESLWLKINMSSGGLNHSFADPRHRDIMIDTAYDAVAVAGLFLSGRLFSVEGKIAAAAAKTSARLNELDFHTVCSKNPNIDKNFGGRNLIKLVSEKVVEVRGVAVGR